MQFLNRVYVTANDKSVAYEIVKADESLSCISISRVSVDKLKEIAAGGDTTDFYFEDDFLRCAPVSRDRIVKDIERTVDAGCIVTDEFCDPNTFFSLIHVGADNGFLFLNENIVKKDSWIGDDVTEFLNVRFCDDTMSAWYLQKNKSESERRNLIVSKNNDFSFVPFYYASPKEFYEYSPGKFVKNMEINNCSYNVYFVDSLQLIEPVDIISAPLINKACCRSSKLRNIICVLNVLLGYENEVIDRSEDEWPGKTVQTVAFESSVAKLTKSEADMFVNLIKIGAEVPKVVHAKFNYLYDVCFDIYSNSSDKMDLIARADFIRKKFEQENLCLELYLFKIRAFECKTGYRRLHEGMILTGSDERGFTTVKREG